MSKGRVVLDTSALLALMHQEPGSDKVQELMMTSGAELSSVNLSELVAKHSELGIPTKDTVALVQLTGTNIQMFDSELAIMAGSLRAQTKHLGLSLGDRACLALGIKLQLPVLTADRTWDLLKLHNLEIIQIR